MAKCRINLYDICHTLKLGNSGGYVPLTKSNMAAKQRDLSKFP